MSLADILSVGISMKHNCKILLLTGVKHPAEEGQPVGKGRRTKDETYRRIAGPVGFSKGYSIISPDLW